MAGNIQTILAIDTSCDETSVAITMGRRIIAQRIYSQIVVHRAWGGVVPSLAKRAHEERIGTVIDACVKAYAHTIPHARGAYSRDSTIQNHVDAIAVTYGPGLAIALEVGIAHAKQIALQFHKPLIAVNHMEGHIYSCFAQNRNGNPPESFTFPYLAMLISGGHTQWVLVSGHGKYSIIGSTVDDAAGEALDKAAKLLGLGYPGGPVIETLAAQVQNKDRYAFPRPMIHTDSVDCSFSGLKTSFYYFLQKMTQQEKNDALPYLASGFQEAVIDTLIAKTKKALDQTTCSRLLVAGGVSANKRLRSVIRKVMRERQGTVLFPSFPSLSGDNAAMIGVAGYYQGNAGNIVSHIDQLERLPRLDFDRHR